MNESLEAITKCIEWYKKTKEANPNELVEVLRVISSHLFTLETFRADYKKEYEALIFDITKDGISVNRAINEAETRIPELYMLRHIIDAAGRVCDSIRTQISLAKHEITRTNN